MNKYLYLAVFSTLGTSMFTDYLPDFGLKAVKDQLIQPVSAQVNKINNEANQQIDSLEGVVTAVSDGDTLTLNSKYGNSTIRLFAIDAPEAKCHGFSDNVCTETGQPGGKAAKLYLRNLTLNKNAVVILGQGMSGKRLVGTVLVDGKDINLEMVKAGYAWHYKYFAKNQDDESRQTYTAAENNAKWLRIGLWDSQNPTPPWDWRKYNKN